MRWTDEYYGFPGGNAMKQTTIELINDYFIEVDELNHTLKKRQIR